MCCSNVGAKMRFLYLSHMMNDLVGFLFLILFFIFSFYFFNLLGRCDICVELD